MDIHYLSRTKKEEFSNIFCISEVDFILIDTDKEISQEA
jgi:hypothetical protein